MASEKQGKGGSAAKAKSIPPEQIELGFQELRQQQRAVASKMSELEMERKEHDLVIEALKEVDADRKCFRMVGGVLVERTVKEVLPALLNNHEQLGKVVESLTAQLQSKGQELNEYREKHNIRIRGEESKSDDQSSAAAKATQGVLVANDST